MHLCTHLSIYDRGDTGPGSIHLLKTIKTAMDPANIMNPGKVIDLEEEDCGCGGHDKKL